MGRYARLAAASAVPLLLVTGCTAGSPRYHDTLICEKFATGASAADSPGTRAADRYTHFARAVTLGRNDARRPGYLSPRLARDVRAVTSGGCNIGRAVQAFTADCRAGGVKRPVWLLYVGSCG